MLLRFGVSNHLSIRDHQELSFVASSLKDRKEGLIACPVAPNGSVVPAVMVYGANASGKSNLVDAMRLMRAMVVKSHARGVPGGGVPRQAFRLDPSSSQAPSRFDIDFVIGGVRHHYGFEASDRAFVSEWLYTFPKSRRRTAFARESSDFVFGRWLKGQNHSIAKMTRPNSLFLSAAAQNGHQQLSRVFAYFQSISVVRAIAIPGMAASAQLADDEPDSRVIDFLGKIGTGVVDYRRNETEPPEEIRTLVREMSGVLRKRANWRVEFEPHAEDKQVSIELAHRGLDGGPIYLDLDRESAGIRRLLVVLGRAYRALDEGVPLLIDELDASLHTHASEAVLELFCSVDANPKGAQLLATTHDTNLMNSSTLRRDQLWFTRKKANGATQIFPLSDFRTRRSDNFERGYLQGRYGAVPFEELLSTLGEPT